MNDAHFHVAISSLGVSVNLEKSVIMPKQTIDFIGATLHSDRFCSMGDLIDR